MIPRDGFRAGHLAVIAAQLEHARTGMPMPVALSENLGRKAEWRRSNSEGVEVFVRTGEYLYPEWAQRLAFNQTMLPTTAAMTLDDFCKKFYPLPEITPELASFAIGQGLHELGLMREHRRMLAWLRNGMELHELLYEDLVKSVIKEELIYGAGNTRLNGRQYVQD